MANAKATGVKAENAKAKMPARAPLRYQSGFGNEFVSEAVEGVLPRGQNSPQKVAHGLYTEQLSGTAFTAPRGVHRWRTSRSNPSAREGCAAHHSTRCGHLRTSCVGDLFRFRLLRNPPTS